MGFDWQHWLLEVQIKLNKLFTEIWLDKLRHRAKQAYRQGYYGISILIPWEKKIYAWNEDKLQGQKTIQNKTRQGQKWYKYATITHLMGPIGPYKAWKFMHTDHRVTHTPWKVDRKLQWMLHHPTNPTYICVLSWTVTQLSAQL